MKYISKDKTSKSLSIIFLLFILFSHPYYSIGQTADEIRNKIDQKNIEIANLEKEIESYKNALNQTDKEKSSLANELKTLELTKKSLQTDLKLTESKISSTSLQIQNIDLDIDKKKDIIENNKASLREGFRKIDEYDNVSLIERMLDKKTLSDGWNEVAQVQSFQDSVSKSIRELQSVKKSLEENKEQVENAKDVLVDLKIELGDKKKIVEINAGETNKLLKDTKNKESNYKKLLADKEALKESVAKEIDDFESKLKFILDPSTLPTGAVLSWPLDKVVITQRFGKTVAGKKLYATGSHNGVDFGVPTGTPVKSMGNGVVIGQGNTDLTCKGASFGKWILIKYDNGLSSTYGHLSLIKVVEGQKVSTGEIVGYSGNTGYSTGPHLHVSMYASGGVEVLSKPSRTCGGRIYTMPFAAMNVYLDPLLYLPTNGTFVDRGLRGD
jgi:murein DD-endopeptidase MepM/ murein hydrolase activator NlpD